MEEQFYKQLFILIAGAIGGYVTAVAVLKLVLFALAVPSAICFLVSVSDENSRALGRFFGAVTSVLGLMVGGIIDHGGLMLLIGYLIGAMLKLYRWKIENERRRGIVRMPIYPSPQ